MIKMLSSFFSFFTLLFANSVFAQAPAAAKSPSMMEMLIMPVGFLVIMYFFVMRPQQKRAKEQQNLLSALKPGDEIITSFGLFGKVKSVQDKTVSLDVGGNTTVKVLKSAVSTFAQNEKPQAAS